MQVFMILQCVKGGTNLLSSSLFQMIYFEMFGLWRCCLYIIYLIRENNILYKFIGVPTKTHFGFYK